MSRKPRRRRTRWLRRLALLAAATATLVAVGAAYLSSDAFARRVRHTLIERGSEALGEDLHIHHLDISLWPLDLDLRGIEVRSRDPLRPGQEILAIERVSVEGIRIGGLRHVDVARLRIERPVLRLRVGNGELRDFPGLRRGGGEGGEGSTPLFLQQLEISDGTVSVSVDRPDLSVQFTGIHTTLTSSSEQAAEAMAEVEDVRLRVGQVEERISLQSGRIVREGDQLAVEGYRLVSRAGSLAIDGELVLSPKDDSGAIVGTLGYDLDAVVDVDLGVLSSGNDALTTMAGEVDLHARTQGVDGDPQVDGHLELADGRFGPHVFGDADVRLRYRDRGLDLVRLWMGYAGGEITGAGRVSFGEHTTLFADLQFDEVQLAEVFENNTLPDPWVMLIIDGSARVDGDFRDGVRLLVDVDFPCRDLRVHDSSWHDRPFNRLVMGLDHGRITGQVEVLPDRTLLREMRVVTERSDLALEVDFIYHKPLIMDMRIDARALAMQDVYRIAGVTFSGRGPAQVRMHGLTKDLQLEGHADLHDFELIGYPLGRVEADIFWRARQDLVFEDVVATLDETRATGAGRVMFKPSRIQGSLDFDDGRIEDVVGIFSDRLEVTGGFDGHIDVIGPVRELDGSAWVRGRQVDLLGEAFTSVQASTSIQDGRFTFPDVWLRKGRGGIYGRGYLDTHGPLDVELFTYAMDLAQVDALQRLSLPLAAQLEGDIHLWGDLRDPLLHGSLHLSQTRYGRAGLDDSDVTVTLRGGELKAFGNLVGGPANRLEGTLDLAGRGAYAFRFDWHALPLHLLLSARTLARSPVTLFADGHIGGDGHLEGEADHDIELELSRLELVRGEDELSNAGPIKLRIDRDRLVVDQLRLTGPGSNLWAEGSVGPGPAVAIRAAGDLALALVDIFVPALGRCEAERSHVRLEAVGVRPGVQLDAEVVVERGFVRTVHFPHALEVDRGRFSLRDGVIRADEFTGRLGGGDLVGLEGSTIELLDRRPHRYDVNAKCVDCTVRYPSMLPWARGTADLHLTGTVPMVGLWGDVAVQDMIYREDFNWQSSILTTGSRRTSSADSADEEPEAGGKGKGVFFGIDLEVHTEQGFGISNNLGQASAGGTLRVIGDSRRVGVDGEIATTGGRVWFRGHDFDLTAGTFTFPDPWAIDPHFRLELDTEVATREQRYSIHYHIEGNLSNVGAMQIRGSSSPLLSEADINALLLFGVTTDDLEGLGSGSDVAALAAQGGNIMMGYLMEQVREAGGSGEQLSALPDRIELVPDYSSTTAVTEFRLQVGKELVRDRLTGQLYWTLMSDDFGLGMDWRVGRNLYLIPAWNRRSDDLGTYNLIGDFGDASLDMRWVIEGD